ncbi:hypothetical protein SS50377_21102 [Spironucleus salmonicida]|uniref:Uncharacterized protein n=2 Tax=Spironucleus TaxID=39709 RepID=V6LSV9_9EUKA|nr:hypothetical protein SS50377_21102 [Spironucleus salmonicida]|eukprot:EST43884.1 Hypothetical protein SS50377_16184 [Spironucleus salmonicida]
MTTIHICKTFQTLSNDFFFELCQANLADCLQSFTTLTSTTPPLQFIQIVSKCANSLLISPHDIEPLTNQLLTGLCSEFPEASAFCAAILPRAMAFLQPDQQNDVCEDLCEALNIFLASGNEKILIPLIISVISATFQLQNELQQGHLIALKTLLKAASIGQDTTEIILLSQSFALSGARKILELQPLKIMYKIDDVCVIEKVLKEMLICVKSQQFGHSEVFLMILKLFLAAPICQSLLRCPIYLSSLLSFLGRQLLSEDVCIRSIVRALMANLLLLDAFLGSDAVEECQILIDILRVRNVDGNYIKRVQRIVQERFEQYQANYSIPARMCQPIKFM